MRVSGSANLSAPRAHVWKALNDPAVLVRTIPGCHRLETIGPDSYRMTLTAGVASIKGVYQGEVSLSAHEHPSTFVLTAAGAGAPGTVSAEVTVNLSEVDDATTTVTYDANAVIGGMIGGVGQRMLAGVARRTAAEFFAAVEQSLTTPAMDAGPAPTASDAGPSSVVDPNATGSVPAAEHLVRDAGTPVYAAPVVGALRGGDFVRGAMVGAGSALLGALVGAYLAGRRTG